MKLLIIYLYVLTNSGHYEFVHSILEFALKCQGITNRLAKWFLPFKAAVEEEGRLLAISLKSVITEQLAQLDRQRDGIVAALHGATNAMMKSVVAEKAEAAQSVMNELTSLKVDPNDNYMNQTGQIDTLCDVLMGKERENIAKIGLTSLVQELYDANQLMHALMDQRDAEQFDRMNDSLAKARKVTDKTYDDFVRSLESYTFLNAEELQADDEGFSDFVNKANTRIEYFRRYVIKTTTVPEGSKPDAGENGGDSSEGEDTQKPEGGDDQKPTDTPTEGGNGGENTDDNTGSNNGENTEGGNTGGTPPEQENPNQPPPPTGGGESGFD